jgi:hypothetical protein
MNPLDPRAEELLTQEALQGLDEAELRELQDLLGDQLDPERDTFARAVAGLDLAHTDPTSELPAHLRERILQEVAPFLREAPASIAPPAAPPTASQGVVVPLPSRPGAALPWVIAAACLVAALVALWVRPPPAPPQIVSVTVTVSVPVPVPPPPPPAPREARAQLLARGLAPIPWGGTKDPAAQGVEGDVLWDNARQEGYMRFRGLAANDPQKIQYQLWIFDKNQDARHPVDGGVFDVNAEGEVVVPITAKLQVREPTLFAITIEKPGGVVVSSRERLVLAAKVPAG